MAGPKGFDRVADVYDRSRSIPPEALAHTVELLVSELGGRSRALEVGVGTGLLALPLHGRGIELVGLDIAQPMMSKLVEKAGGRRPFPLVLGDATRMPVRDDAVGAAYLRWVLHLVPDWPTMLAEITRVVRPGGVFLASMGNVGPARREIQERFGELTGVSTRPVGLDWEAYDELDARLERLGASVRRLPSLDAPYVEPLEDFVEGIEEDRYSWTWQVPADDRIRAVAETRRWARERFGDLSAPYPETLEIVWRAYDLP